MRLIDEEELKERMCRQCNAECGDDPCEPDECFVRTVILDAPTIDAVEVVRCKDCRYWHEDALACEYLPRSENGTRSAWYGDDFCSYGERRNDDL